MQLTGRMREIVEGQSGLPEHKAEAYRARWKSRGYEIDGRSVCQPGTNLKAMLRRIGVAPVEKCGCESTANKMDEGGPQWCRDNMSIILDAMRKNHGMLQATGQTRLPWVRLAAKFLVLRAIRKTEKQMKS